MEEAAHPWLRELGFQVPKDKTDGQCEIFQVELRELEKKLNVEQKYAHRRHGGPWDGKR